MEQAAEEIGLLYDDVRVEGGQRDEEMDDREWGSGHDCCVKINIY